MIDTKESTIFTSSTHDIGKYPGDVFSTRGHISNRHISNSSEPILCNLDHFSGSRSYMSDDSEFSFDYRNDYQRETSSTQLGYRHGSLQDIRSPKCDDLFFRQEPSVRTNLPSDDQSCDPDAIYYKQSALTATCERLSIDGRLTTDPLSTNISEHIKESDDIIKQAFYIDSSSTISEFRQPLIDVIPNTREPMLPYSHEMTPVPYKRSSAPITEKSTPIKQHPVPLTNPTYPLAKPHFTLTEPHVPFEVISHTSLPSPRIADTNDVCTSSETCSPRSFHLRDRVRHSPALRTSNPTDKEREFKSTGNIFEGPPAFQVYGILDVGGTLPGVNIAEEDISTATNIEEKCGDLVCSLDGSPSDGNSVVEQDSLDNGKYIFNVRECVYA